MIMMTVLYANLLFNRYKEISMAGLLHFRWTERFVYTTAEIKFVRYACRTQIVHTISSGQWVTCVLKQTSETEH